MKKMHASTTVNSYDELVRLVKKTKKRSNVVLLENFEYSNTLSLRQLLVDIGLYKEVKRDYPLTLTHPILISNVKCKAFTASGICIENSANWFQINNSIIESVKIHDCKISSFEIAKSIISELAIIDSIFLENVILDYLRLPNTSPVKIDFENTTFGGDVVVSHLKMVNNISQFLMSGEDMEIYGNFLLYQSYLICGKLEFTCDFKRNCVLRMINSSHDENHNQLIPNMGDISINGGEIVEDLVLEDCHFNSLHIANTPVGGTREFEFTYNILKDNAAIVLRDGASKKNNVLLVEKYTAELFDTQLKDKAKDTYKKWISILDNKQVKVGKKCRKFHSLIMEPIELLIPSLTSSEGILLWLNKYSNDFNRSWIRGVGFTLTTTLLLYFLLNYTGMEQPFFYFDLHLNGFSEVVKGYLSLLDVFNLTGLSDDIKFNLSIWGYILLLIGKTLITYGFWQTIYAFYRYRK